MIPLSVIAAGLGCWAASKSIQSASPRVLVVD